MQACPARTDWDKEFNRRDPEAQRENTKLRFSGSFFCFSAVKNSFRSLAHASPFGEISASLSRRLRLFSQQEFRMAENVSSSIIRERRTLSE